MSYNREDSPLYQLLLSGKRIVLPKNQVVDAFSDSARCYLITSGYIMRYLITREGAKGIQVIYGPGDIFPLTPVYKTVYEMDIYSGPEQYYYEAMTPIEVYSATQETIEQAAADNPEIYKDLFYAAGIRLNSYIHRLESMSLRVANKKVAHQLSYFAQNFGVPDENGTLIPVPLTHQTLADILNLARETVTHCLAGLQTKGLILASGKHVVVTDLDKLKRASR